MAGPGDYRRQPFSKRKAIYTIEYVVQLPGEAVPRKQMLQSNEPSWAALVNKGTPGVVMWKALFNDGWKANFQARMAAYRPKWILNACTAAVKAEVDAALPLCVSAWDTNHPSSLWIEKRLAARVR